MFRFALSPIGDMNINNLRVAIYNYMCAKQKGEKFIIRIEDSDIDKNIEAKDQEILELLSLFGIIYDEVVYQSNNLKYHRQLAMKLMIDKKAFACFCPEDLLEKKKKDAKKTNQTYKYDGTCEFLSDEEVLNNEKPFVIRAKKPNSIVTFYDHIQGDMNFEPDDVDSFIILKVNKYPTYDFACALDDMLYDISFIIREEKYLLSTPKQELIRKYLGYDKKIEYAHLPIINTHDTKINKEHNISNIKWLLEEGFLPSAIVNYLILLGNNKISKDIFTLTEALTWFDIKSISKTPVKFDIDKLRFINREHIKLIEPLELSKMVGFSSKDIGELVKLYTKEVSTINELKLKIETIFSEKESSKNKKNLDILKNIIKNAPYFKEFNEFERYLLQESNLKEKEFSKTLRFLITGTKQGLNLSDIYPYIKNYITEIAR